MKRFGNDNVINFVFKKYGIYLIFVLIIVVCSLLSPVFLTKKNIMSVLRQLSITGILAFAQMLLIISGQIDLSQGSVVALAGMVSITTYLSTGSFILTFATAIIVAMVCGAISGILIAKVRLPAFIATMAMDSVARGMVYIYTNGQPIYNVGDYSKVSTGYIGSIPMPVVVFIGIAGICWIILSHTTFGRDIYAIGGNADAANASGISVPKTTIKAYLVAGAFVGIAAVLQMARINSGLPDTAMNYHGDAIASTIIGGTSFTGGIGTASGTFVGSIIMGVISNILNLTGVQSYIQNVVKGLIIIGAVTIDLLGKNRRIRKKPIVGTKGISKAEK